MQELGDAGGTYRARAVRYACLVPTVAMANLTQEDDAREGAIGACRLRDVTRSSKSVR